MQAVHSPRLARIGRGRRGQAALLDVAGRVAAPSPGQFGRQPDALRRIHVAVARAGAGARAGGAPIISGRTTGLRAHASVRSGEILARLDGFRQYSGSAHAPYMALLISARDLAPPSGSPSRQCSRIQSCWPEQSYSGSIAPRRGRSTRRSWRETASCAPRRFRCSRWW